MHNLVDELPWIPVLAKGGGTRLLTLDQTIAAAHEIEAVACDNPVETAAVWRLLCAAALRSGAADGTGRGLDTTAMRDYLRRHRHRFDLADTPAPFMQPAGCDGIPVQSASAIVPERIAGRDPVWFAPRDPGTHEAAETLPPGRAARALLATHAAGPGGLQRGPAPKGAEPATGERAPALSGPAGPASRNAVLIACTGDLADSIAAGTCAVATHSGDLPAWERPPTGPGRVRRTPTGTVDYLTWQPKRVHLTWNGAGHCDGAAVWAGDDIGKVDPFDYDPHIAIRFKTVDGKAVTEPLGSHNADPVTMADLLEADPRPEAGVRIDTARARGALAAWAEVTGQRTVTVAVYRRLLDIAAYRADWTTWLHLTTPPTTGARDDATQPVLF